MAGIVESCWNPMSAFFDTAEETLEEEIQKELRRVCFYLNLNARQSLLLFQDVYCDYQLVATSL